MRHSVKLTILFLLVGMASCKPAGIDPAYHPHYRIILKDLLDLPY